MGNPFSRRGKAGADAEASAAPARVRRAAGLPFQRPGLVLHEIADRGSVPQSARAVRRLAAIAGGLVLALGATAGVWRVLTPLNLGEAALDGPRGPGCLRLVLVADVSGSMEALAAPRDAAVAQLLAWAPRNLRPDDELAMVTFASDAVVTIPPTRIDRPAVRSDARPVADSTSFDPVVARIAAFKQTRCQTGLVLLSDGQFGDLKTSEMAATRQLAAARVDSIAFLVPGRIEIPTNWSQIYPSAPPDFFDGANSDQTALAVARHIADFTHQSLRRRQN